MCISEVNAAFLACFFLLFFLLSYEVRWLQWDGWLPTLTPSCCTVWFMHFWFTHTAHIIFVQQGVWESSGPFISSCHDLVQLFRLKQTPNRATLRSRGKNHSRLVSLHPPAEGCWGVPWWRHLSPCPQWGVLVPATPRQCPTTTSLWLFGPTVLTILALVDGPPPSRAGLAPGGPSFLPGHPGRALLVLWVDVKS